MRKIAMAVGGHGWLRRLRGHFAASYGHTRTLNGKAGDDRVAVSCNIPAGSGRLVHARSPLCCRFNCRHTAVHGS